MNRHGRHHRLARHNILFLIGLGLICYFSFHILLGERSYSKLVSLEYQLEQVEAEYSNLQSGRKALENKVVRLRPATLDLDLLDERVRSTLGYVSPSEQIIIVSE